ISSSIFLAWQRAVGGRIKSDLRFSATIVWNNLPLPEVSEKNRKAIIDAGKGVLKARALHPDRSLADHYNPLAMAPELISAHDALDRVVDRAFGARKALKPTAERQELLFTKDAVLVKVQGGVACGSVVGDDASCGVAFGDPGAQGDVPAGWPVPAEFDGSVGGKEL